MEFHFGNWSLRADIRSKASIKSQFINTPTFHGIYDSLSCLVPDVRIIVQHVSENQYVHTCVDGTHHGILQTGEIKACEDAGISVTLPKPQKSGAKAEGRFGKQDFVYVAADDVYIDQLLRKDGYTLALAGKISGSPHYTVRLAPDGSPADDEISAALAAFDPTQVHARWTSALERRASEPEGAITLARTLLEDVIKWILDQAGETWQETDDLPVLYRKLAKVLKLAPDCHTEQVFKQILGSCQSVVESLGALRNKLSDAHSVGPKRARPQPRHAELAVNLAGAMATFLVSTWEARRKEREGHSDRDDPK